MSDADEFLEAIRSDDPREALTALRDRLAEGVLAADDRRLIHLAPLAKQLVDVLDKIDQLPAPADQEDPLDELVRQWASGSPATEGS